VALTYAAFYGSLKVAKLLVSKGAKVNSKVIISLPFSLLPN
jgi:ankyrin repeat protein